MHRILARGSLAALAAAGLACAALDFWKAPDPVAVRVGSEEFTVSELDAKIKEDLWKQQTGDGNPSRLYELRLNAAKWLVQQRALDAEANKRGLTRDAMLDEEFKQLPPVDEAAVKAFYDQNTAKVQGAPLEALAQQIRSHLEGEAKRKAVETIVAKYDPHIDLVRPRVALRPGGQAKGPANARVTLVEFSDFQCPFCQQAKPVLDEIAKRHPNDVRIVYRNLPLESLHPRARASAEAGG
jgi:thiol-disulfide isomerase/thioredoxin